MTGADDLGGRLLEGVSRSFYLTLKALPQGIREPLSLAYLLARAADTMADTPTVADAIKLDCLGEFGQLIQEKSVNRPAETQLSQRLISEFVPHQEDVHEAQLLRKMPELFTAFHQSPSRHVPAIREVLHSIVCGQMLDIQRFPSDGRVRALATAADLDEYTYLVAGCVGEFWTKIGATSDQDAFSPEVSQPELIEWGIRYGKGLQLVNILRDVVKDARMGRCYLPAEQLAAQHITLDQVKDDPTRLMPLMAPWLQKCREHLACGLLYLDAIQQKRLLYATALPLLIAYRTVTLIEKADGTALLKGVKVSRGEVGKLLLEAGMASLRKGGIRRMAEKIA